MNKILIALLVLLGATVPAAAQNATLGKLTIVQPWARATVTPTGAAYLVIDNAGDADKLLKVETPLAKAELHTHALLGDVWMMRPIDSLPLPPGRTFMSPSGHHIMLMGLKAPLKQGATFPMTLTFEKAGTIEVTVKIEKPGAIEPTPPVPPAPVMPTTPADPVIPGTPVIPGAPAHKH